ncbi:hypothetical protein D1007_55587 [Hordeum vulgare]|nr:hypothetical protein D1007_55587 [Hordeum vulgare]
MSGRACRDEIQRRLRRLPDDLYYDPMYAVDPPLWDKWFRDEHDVWRASYFVGDHNSPRRARADRWARSPSPFQVCGLTPTSSHSDSSSPPPPPPMTEEEEARLVQRGMEDSMNTHDERQWVGLKEMMAHSAAGDVAIPEVKEEVHEEQPLVAFPPDLVGQRWTWSCTATEMARGPSLGVPRRRGHRCASHRHAGR